MTAASAKARTEYLLRSRYGRERDRRVGKEGGRKRGGIEETIFWPGTKIILGQCLVPLLSLSSLPSSLSPPYYDLYLSQLASLAPGIISAVLGCMIVNKTGENRRGGAGRGREREKKSGRMQQRWVNESMLSWLLVATRLGSVDSWDTRRSTLVEAARDIINVRAVLTRDEEEREEEEGRGGEEEEKKGGERRGKDKEEILKRYEVEFMSAEVLLGRITYLMDDESKYHEIKKEKEEVDGDEKKKEKGEKKRIEEKEMEIWIDALCDLLSLRCFQKEMQIFLVQQGNDLMSHLVSSTPSLPTSSSSSSSSSSSCIASSSSTSSTPFLVRAFLLALRLLLSTLVVDRERTRLVCSSSVYLVRGRTVKLLTTSLFCLIGVATRRAGIDVSSWKNDLIQLARHEVIRGTVSLVERTGVRPLYSQRRDSRPLIAQKEEKAKWNKVVEEGGQTVLFILSILNMLKKVETIVRDQRKREGEGEREREREGEGEGEGKKESQEKEREEEAHRAVAMILGLFIDPSPLPSSSPDDDEAFNNNSNNNNNNNTSSMITMVEKKMNKKWFVHWRQGALIVSMRTLRELVASQDAQESKSSLILSILSPALMRRVKLYRDQRKEQDEKAKKKEEDNDFGDFAAFDEEEGDNFGEQWQENVDFVDADEHGEGMSTRNDNKRKLEEEKEEEEEEEVEEEEEEEISPRLVSQVHQELMTVVLLALAASKGRLIFPTMKILMLYYDTAPNPLGGWEKREGGERAEKERERLTMWHQERVKIHEMACKALLRLAQQFAPSFREAVSRLRDEERETLQNALKSALT